MQSQLQFSSRDELRRLRDATRSVTFGDMLLASRRLQANAYPRFALQGVEFHNDDLLPTRASIDGDGSPPLLSWDLLLPRPASLVLICQDPDAESGKPFLHWLVYGISGNAQSLDSSSNDFREGLNDHGHVGFAPAAPPQGEAAHRYVFQLFALDTDLDLPPGATYEQALSAMADHLLAWGQVTGLYERP